MSFTLAILGRPNVGKSTLFNRLAGKRLALVDDTPGVTRDRREADGSLGDLKFTIIDTAGLEEGEEGSLFQRMRSQTEIALAQSDVALMLIDARAGITPLDKHFADWLRRQDCTAILVANKCEGKAGAPGLYESYALGLGEPVPFSAEHGQGLDELYDAIIEKLNEQGLALQDDDGGDDDGSDDQKDEIPDEVEGDLEYSFEDDPALTEKPLQLAIVGRPNVGKSTLINQMIGEDRMITGPEAGLTRDSISVPWSWQGRAVRLFDTAGLRRPARVTEKLERMSTADSIRAIRYANVVILLVDATTGLDRQDLRIANLAADEGRALVLCLNKWDLVADRSAALKKVHDSLTRSLPQLKELEIVMLSAKTGGGTNKLMPAVGRTYDLWNSRIKTATLNRWLMAVTEQHPAPTAAGRRIRIRFMAQIKTRPPTFVLFVNRPGDLPKSYVRYIENELRSAFKLPGVPLRLLLRKGKNPYD